MGSSVFREVESRPVSIHHNADLDAAGRRNEAGEQQFVFIAAAQRVIFTRADSQGTISSLPLTLEQVERDRVVRLALCAPSRKRQCRRPETFPPRDLPPRA